MLRNLFARIRKQTHPAANSSPIAQPSELLKYEPIAKLLSHSGRIAFATLSKISHQCSKNDFIQVLQNPALVGSAIHSETKPLPEKMGSDLIGQTQMINFNDPSLGRPGPGASLPYAIYPLIKRDTATSPADTFKIGRRNINDMTMQDIAISKEHAVIRVSNGTYSIEDCDSTNGTWLNGVRLQKKPLKLSDNDIIGLGQYKFTFMFPASLYDLLRKR